MRAILLAAGQGRRLGVDEPKCLIDIAGRTLLARHVDHLVAAGVDELTLVLGYAHEKLDAAVEPIEARYEQAGQRCPLRIERIFNELYQHGSLVSLQRAAHRLAEGAIWMDADVLYPDALLRRLVQSSHPNCTMLDGRAHETGEEMMLAVRGGRVRRIGRAVGADWDLVGESVGFFKVDREGGAAMKRVLDAEVAAGRLDQEHEDALDQALDLVPFGYERVDDLPWTEIDFPEDVERARGLAAELN